MAQVLCHIRGGKYEFPSRSLAGRVLIVRIKRVDCERAVHLDRLGQVLAVEKHAAAKTAYRSLAALMQDRIGPKDDDLLRSNDRVIIRLPRQMHRCQIHLGTATETQENQYSQLKRCGFDLSGRAGHVRLTGINQGDETSCFESRNTGNGSGLSFSCHKIFLPPSSHAAARPRIRAGDLARI